MPDDFWSGVTNPHGFHQPGTSAWVGALWQKDLDHNERQREREWAEQRRQLAQQQWERNNRRRDNSAPVATGRPHGLVYTFVVSILFLVCVPSFLFGVLCGVAEGVHGKQNFVASSYNVGLMTFKSVTNYVATFESLAMRTAGYVSVIPITTSVAAGDLIGDFSVTLVRFAVSRN